MVLKVVVAESAGVTDRCSATNANEVLWQTKSKAQDTSGNHFSGGAAESWIKIPPLIDGEMATDICCTL